MGNQQSSCVPCGCSSLSIRCDDNTSGDTKHPTDYGKSNSNREERKNSDIYDLKRDQGPYQQEMTKS